MDLEYGVVLPFISALFFGFALAYIFLEFRARSQKQKERRPIVIGSPTNIQHQSHIGFSPDGTLVIRNLPPQYQVLFDNINDSLNRMGVDKVTEKEAKLILKALPILATSTPKPRNVSGAIREVSNTEEVLSLQSQLRSKTKEVDDLKRNMELERKAFKDEIVRLRSEKSSSNQDQAFTNLQNLTDQISSLTQTIQNLERENQELKEINSQLEVQLSSVHILDLDISNQAPIPPPIIPETPSINPAPTKASPQPTRSDQPRTALLEAIRNPSIRLRPIANSPSREKRDAILEDSSVGGLIASALIKRRQYIKDDAMEDDNLEQWI
jgi:hypothetical protein